jgi:hypothetical protein
MNTETPQKRKELAAKLRSNFHDSLYVSGSLFVIAGVALVSRPGALIATGGFLLLAPVLEIVSGFIRGVRSQM